MADNMKEKYESLPLSELRQVAKARGLKGISTLRKERYERAVEWLRAVAAEELSADGLPLLPEETRAAKSNFLIKSNRKRVNHW